MSNDLVIPIETTTVRPSLDDYINSASVRTMNIPSWLNLTVDYK